MPLLLLIKSLGWILAHAPESLLRALAAALGAFLHVGLPRRRRLLRSNLAHAFPDLSFAARERIARESCRRLVETGLLSLASPYLSAARLRQMLRAGPGLQDMLRERRDRPHPTVLVSAHLAYWEAQTWMAVLTDLPLGDFGVIYRPLDHPGLDDFVRRTRERFGMRLLSRKAGFAEAARILRHNGCVGILFDQNAGMQGALTTLFGRVCSTTELPGILAEKFGAEVRVITAHRLGFWRVELRITPVPHDGSAAGVVFALNRWLEATLSRDDGLRESWLWSHDRWRHQDRPAARFRLESRRDLLALEQRARGWAELPRRTRLFVRLPNWLGDVVMALPLLRALRAARPDMALTLIGKGPFRDVCELGGLGFEDYVPLPSRGAGYWRQFRALAQRWPDTYLLLTQSIRGDVEAWLTACPQRFGLVRPGHPRPLLTHAYRRPSGTDPRRQHQFEEWLHLLRHFGLETDVDRRPASLPAVTGAPRVGLICGSENHPAKRWPAAHWSALIRRFPDVSFFLFGTPADRTITDAVAAACPGAKVENLAGRTTLREFGERLRACTVLVSNDTGGMHLANALGVPVIALFGPTNPIRTAPVFSSDVEILQPPGCPPTGGGALSDLVPEAVAASLQRRLGRLADGV